MPSIPFRAIFKSCFAVGLPTITVLAGYSIQQTGSSWWDVQCVYNNEPPGVETAEQYLANTYIYKALPSTSPLNDDDKDDDDDDIRVPVTLGGRNAVTKLEEGQFAFLDFFECDVDRQVFERFCCRKVARADEKLLRKTKEVVDPSRSTASSLSVSATSNSSSTCPPIGNGSKFIFTPAVCFFEAFTAAFFFNWERWFAAQVNPTSVPYTVVPFQRNYELGKKTSVWKLEHFETSCPVVQTNKQQQHNAACNPLNNNSERKEEGAGAEEARSGGTTDEHPPNNRNLVVKEEIVLLENCSEFQGRLSFSWSKKDNNGEKEEKGKDDSAMPKSNNSNASSSDTISLRFGTSLWPLPKEQLNTFPWQFMFWIHRLYCRALLAQAVTVIKRGGVEK